MPTYRQAEEYLEPLKAIVNSLSPEDLIARPGAEVALDVGDPLRRTLGSLLIWDKSDAGLNYGPDELKFLAKGEGGRLLDTLTSDWEPALVTLAQLDRPKTLMELSAAGHIAPDRMRDFVRRLLRIGFQSPFER